MIISKLYPSDYNVNYGKLGIKLPMNKNPRDEYNTIFNMSNLTEEQSVSNYINLLMTRKGERYMQPDFGVGLMNYVFEQNTEEVLAFLEAEIETQAAMWLPYIYNEAIDVVNEPKTADLNEGHGIGIAISFKVTERGANRTLKVFKVDGQPIIRIG